MSTVILLASLICSSGAHGDDVVTVVSSRTAQKLQDFRFEVPWCGDAATQTTTQPAVSPDLRAEAEKRLRDVTRPGLFGTADQPVELTVCRMTSARPDGFAAYANVAGEQVTAFVSELQTDFGIVFAAPRQRDTQTALTEFHSWVARLLNPGWEKPVSDQELEVRDRGEYFEVRKVFFDEQGARRFIPWSRPESVRVAVDKDGHWLILSVGDLPEKVSSMPAAFRIKRTGSWFDWYGSGARDGKKKDVQSAPSDVRRKAP